MKDVLIVILLGLLVWFGSALVRVENERYALLLDMCPRPHNAALAVPDCRDVRTRTNWAWHLAYGLGIL